MTKEELSALIEQARTAATDVERNNVLLRLHEDCGGVIAAHEGAIERSAALERENAEYAKQNNSLWLKLSAQPNNPNQEGLGDDTGEQNAPKLKYEDLKF